MSAWKKLASAPAASGGGVNVEEVFSTYLWKGTSTALDVTNNIDFTGEGGMLWIKPRINSTSHWIQDTERGAGKLLRTNVANTELDLSSSHPDLHFSSDGFGVAAGLELNYNGQDMASWSFRKAPKFFDVVTYTGDGNDNRTVSHNLGSSPGVVLVKKTDASDSWIMWHRSVPNGYLSLNVTSELQNYTTRIKSANDTTFTLGASGQTNSNGASYVAYLFAHNDGDGEFGPTADQDIIKCGSYTGNGSTTGPKVDVGFLPQFVLIKAASRTGNWAIYDTMRGFTDVVGSPTGDPDKGLFPNLTSGESAGTVMRPYVDGTEQGFQLQQTSVNTNASNQTYIYIAIRRGPMAVPESATEVFDVTTYTADNTDNRVITTGNKVDTVLARNRNNTSERGFNIGDRIRGNLFLPTARTYGDGYDSDSFMGFDHPTGFEVGNDATRRLNYSNYTQIAYTWTRANSFYDVALYTGNGSNQNITHNLGVTPNMIWIKRRDASEEWLVWHDGIHSTTGETDYLRLHVNNPDTAFGVSYMSVSSTGLSFTGGYGPTNTSNGKYIAYLFATLAGVSKVGSYTGTGSSQTIDCGFSSGARWVMVKRAAGGNGDWIVWDSTRGINSGNDPYLGLNRTDEEITNTDYIDPHSSGFTISGGNAVGASGSTYIFYAIA